MQQNNSHYEYIGGVYKNRYLSELYIMT